MGALLQPKDCVKITVNSGVCDKHFDSKFIKDGQRKRLIWEQDPVPTNYAADIDIPPSVLPTPQTTRKPPTDRSQPDQMGDFRKKNMIKSLADITNSFCPPGYKLEVHDGKAAIILFPRGPLNG